MPLPTLFASLTNPDLPELDGNFAALGALVSIPCTVAGTNVIALTPLTLNVPSVTTYTQYQTYIGIAAAGNTGPTTAGVGSLGVLPVYKDTALGPAALTGGEIATNNAIFLTYDSALNSGNGGFHLGTGPYILAALFLPLIGGTLTGNLALPSLTLPAATGSSLTRLRSTTASISWPVLTAGQSSIANVALTGIQIGDVAKIGFPSSVVQSGIGYNAFVSSPSVVSVEAFNFTPSSSLTPTGGAYRVSVEGYT